MYIYIYNPEGQISLSGTFLLRVMGESCAFDETEENKIKNV